MGVLNLDVRLIAFDVYGTLFDVSSLRDHVARALGGSVDPDAFLDTWRLKQIEYSFLVSLMGWFEDFKSITVRALKYTLKFHGLKESSNLIDSLIRGWGELKPYSDTVRVIPRLSERFRLATLTNGSRDAISSLLDRWGLKGYFTDFLSVTDVKIYKPSPKVYRLVERLGFSISQTLMVSSNPWDVAGAVNAGMRVCYLNRRGLPLEELGLEPDIEVGSLDELYGILTK